MTSVRNLAASQRNALTSPNLLSKAVAATLNACAQVTFCSGQYPTVDFAEGYLLSVFWSKYASPGLSKITGKDDVSPEERSAKAIKKWLVAEKRNSKTNTRLTETCDFGWCTSDELLSMARKYVLETIGKRPPMVLPMGEHTGGASTRIKRGAGAIPSKFEGKAHCSTSAKPYYSQLLFESVGWSLLFPTSWETEAVECSTMFTVPKNSEIDRVACKEPEINMYLQRAAGLFIRSRLKRHGIDLQDQSRNQMLAKEGSIKRNLATMDLSSASDTISRQLVKILLPEAWFTHLDDVRVKQVLLPDGSVHTLEMFSSMGNGFTFELESLIFWALARATATVLRRRGKISVYGDDIIVPKDVGLALHRVLPWFGFIVNVKKTFITGPFRESCGGHYYNGTDVTPIYLRKEIQTVTDVVQLHNQLLGWMLRQPFNGAFVGLRYKDLISLLRSVVSKRLYGGQSLERTDALVTGDAPRYRLVQKNLPVDICQSGGYLWWLHQKERRPESVFSPSEAAILGRWVLRPNRSWYERELMAILRHEFLLGEFSLGESPSIG